MDRDKIKQAVKYFAYEVRFNSSQYGNEEIVPYLQLALSVCREKLENKNMYQNAISFFQEEAKRYEDASRINGSEMTEDWAFGLEMCNIAIKLMKEKCDD